MAILVLREQAVGVKRFCTPAVDAAEAHLVQVHAEDNILVALEFPRELHVSELFRRIMLGAEFHARGTHNQQALTLVVGEGGPLHVGALARFANFHVHHGHGVGIGAVHAHEASAVTADVVFVRATSKVTHSFVAARHRKERTDIQNVALAAVGVERVFHDDIAAAVDSVGQAHARRTHIRECQLECHLGFLGGDFLHLGTSHGALRPSMAPFAVTAFHIEALVIVGRGTPEVRDTAVPDNRIAIKHVACNRCALLVDADLEIVTFNREFVGATGHAVAGQGADVDFSRLGLTHVNRKLLMSNAETGLCPKLVLLQAEVYVEMVFRAVLEFDFRHLDRNVLFLVRSDIQLGTVNFPFFDDLAVFLDLPVTIEEITQVQEEVTAFDAELALRSVHVPHANLAVLILDFPHFGLNLAIGEHESVRAEVVVVLPVAPHAAKFPVRSALVVQALVDKVPDEAAEGARIPVKSVHVFLQIAHGVAHGVFVFAKHHGLVSIVVTVDVIVTPVHLAHHIGIVVVAFVMHVACGVNLVGTFTFRSEHVSVTRLVTQRPQNNAGMVLVALHHAVQAVHHRSAPIIATLGQVAVRSVAFHVRLVNHVNAVLVAKIKHHRVVRVMRHAERIDVEALHQDDVFFHAFVSHRTAVIRIEFVAVHAVELHGHAIHEQARRPVVLLDFHLAETDLVAFDLDNLAGLVLDGEHRRIKVRRFCRPTVRLAEREFKMHALFGSVRANARHLLRTGGNHLGTGCVVEGKFHGKFVGFGSSGIVNPCRRLQQTILVVVGERCVNLEILDMHRRHRINVHVAHDARKTNEVLVLEPATIAPAEHLHRNIVLTLTQVLVNIEFVTRKSVFAIAHVVAVHPHIVGRFHAFKVDADTLAIPLFGNSESAAVMAHRVELGRSARSGDPVVLRPRINNVGINRVVIAVQLPGRRHRKIVPSRHIVIVLVEVVIAFTRLFDMEKFPRARKRLVPFRSVAVPLDSLFYSRVRHRGHVRRKRIHAENTRLAVPFVIRLGICC